MDSAAMTKEEFEKYTKELREKIAQEAIDDAKRVAFGFFDQNIYDCNEKTSDEFVTSIAPVEKDEDDDDDDYEYDNKVKISAPAAILNEIPAPLENYDPLANRRPQKITERENQYQLRRRNRIISPERVDPFADGGKTPAAGSRTYKEVMQETALSNEQEEIRKKLAGKDKTDDAAKTKSVASAPAKRRRWDQPSNEETPDAKKSKTSSWDVADSKTPAVQNQWEETPAVSTFGEKTPTNEKLFEPKTPNWAETPLRKRNRWNETPQTERETPSNDSRWGDTPKHVENGVDSIEGTPGSDTSSKRRSRWDETPVNYAGNETPKAAISMTTPGGSTPTGSKAIAMATPSHVLTMTPEQIQAMRWERDIDERNRPLTDDELDSMLPKGYKVMEPPKNYIPIRTPARKLTATPTPFAGASGFYIQLEERSNNLIENIQPKGDLPLLKPEDAQYFGVLLVDEDEELMTPEQQKERKIMKLLLKIKNGTPPMRKAALRHITDKARELGAGPLFNQILPLLMSPALEDQERHLLVKVIDRILYTLDELVRPFVHKILVVIEPLLIDEDYYARVEGREIISNLSKAAGLATMISTMRPDIDNVDEYVRNTTARAFAVVASALGIPSLLPFLKAVCKSKKSWQARHTGIKMVQQIAILMGCAILPYLKSLVDIIEHGLEDEQQKVRTITALALAALAESATPYGIESFDSAIKPLWKGIRKHRGKGLAAFLKAIGYIIPLMDQEYSNYYTKEVMVILIREFQSPDEEMKKIVLKVVKQCCATDGVEANYIKTDILPHYFRHFWNQRMALDRRNYKQLVDTTVEIANKVGVSEIINRIVGDLNDENEQFRKMVMETVDRVVSSLGADDVDSRLEERLMDGILFAYQEQTTDDVIMLNGFSTVVNALGRRVKMVLPQICGVIKYRLGNASAKVRQQTADLINRIAAVMKISEEDKLLAHFSVVLYENLGEEYPEALGSILGGLKSILSVIGLGQMQPPVKDLLPRLTPILKNRHEKVQENCIDLIGRIADRGSEFVSAKEWMRICFELLDLLKAHKKAIRRATVNTFGYIAKAIGPHDVLATLLNNLKVQERQNRVCTTVAIAIVAETCSPFTVIPALMNEYRVPELNVQNGVLKSLSFLFEYIGEMGKDYIYSVIPLLEDALMDRDLVHRQTACSVVKHLALDVYGFGCDDALEHMLNFVWPNIFETSPHLVQTFMGAVEGLGVALGPLKILQYVLQGLFHPARNVREVYWKVYNHLYINAQDALIAGYPRVPNDSSMRRYERYELDYIL